MSPPYGSSPVEIAGHLALALEMLEVNLRRNRRTVPGWVGPVTGLFRAWATSSGNSRAELTLQPEPRLLTYEQVAVQLGDVSLSTVQRLVTDRRLPVVHVTPRTPRVRVEDLEAFLDGLSVERSGSVTVTEGQGPSISHSTDDTAHGVCKNRKERDAEAA